MLTFNLKKQWYEKIRSGEKTIEYREVKPYWKTRFCNAFGFFPEQLQEEYPDIVMRIRYPCILRLGYTKRHMTANITEIEIVDGKGTDLHIDKPVYAIHLANVKEAE